MDDIAYKLGFGARRRAEVDQQFRERYAPRPGHPLPAPTRIPMTASQHILHLLLTVFTCGLWAPVWIFRASRGNYAGRQDIPADPSAPKPVWPPERPAG